MTGRCAPLNQVSGYLSFQGLRVFYRAAEPEGELKHRILCLSSPLTSTFSWRKLAPELTELGCLMLMVDLPGFGRSDFDRALPGDAETRAHLVWGVLDEIDRMTDAPLSTWHLMSQGMGCAIIAAMHRQYPDSVRSQIHISPMFSPPPPRFFGGSPEKWCRETFGEKMPYRAFIEFACGYPMDDYVLDHMYEPMTRADLPAALLGILRSPGLLPEKSGDFCPAMAIWGGRDPLLTGSEPQIRRLLPDAERHVMKNAGHFITETHSKALRDYLRGWLHYLE